jgi:hypothetical protein
VPPGVSDPTPAVNIACRRPRLGGMINAINLSVKTDQRPTRDRRPQQRGPPRTHMPTCAAHRPCRGPVDWQLPGESPRGADGSGSPAASPGRRASGSARDYRWVANLPETRYARSGDVHIAYQVVGDGPLRSADRSWVHEQHRVDLGAANCGALSASTCCLLTSHRVRPAWDGTVGSGHRCADPRREDGRSAGGDGRHGVGESSDLGADRGWADERVFATTYPDRTSALILYGARPVLDGPQLVPQHNAKRCATTTTKEQ